MYLWMNEYLYEYEYNDRFTTLFTITYVFKHYSDIH